MGFFSAQCKRCDHPLLSPMAVNKINSWMVDAVIITPDGDMHTGEYDGYGRVGGWESEGRLEENSVWHRTCWKLDGKPTTYQGPSFGAADQGWFFNEGDHDLAEP